VRLNKVSGWFGHHRERERVGTFDAYLEAYSFMATSKYKLTSGLPWIELKMKIWKEYGRGAVHYKLEGGRSLVVWFLLKSLHSTSLKHVFDDSMVDYWIFGVARLVGWGPKFWERRRRGKYPRVMRKNVESEGKI